MYLTVLENSMGCVLGQHDESGQKEYAIYYLSKNFTDCETRYSLLEKTCCALAWAACRLRQYMLTHTTLLISKIDLIKYIFEKHALSGRIARWKMILTEYDIQYTTQKAIKVSVLADHLAHQVIDDYQSMHFEFPDEDVLLVTDCEEPEPDEGPEQGSRWSLKRTWQWHWRHHYISHRRTYSFHRQIMFQLYEQHGRIRSVHHGY